MKIAPLRTQVAWKLFPLPTTRARWPSWAAEQVGCWVVYRMVSSRCAAGECMAKMHAATIAAPAALNSLAAAFVLVIMGTVYRRRGHARKGLVAQTVATPHTGRMPHQENPDVIAGRVKFDRAEWDEFGSDAAVMGTDRSSVLRQLAAWWMRKPGAKLPPRPPAP